METYVYVVKTTDSKMPTIYAKDTRMDYVADRIREYLNYPGVNLEWIGVAVIMRGGTADHPRIGPVNINETTTRLFKEMVYNPEGK